MGLFGKKKLKPMILNFYEGELQGFQCNFPCEVLLADSVLWIVRRNPYIEVKLDRKRIASIDILPEREYMAKFKGVPVESPKGQSIHKDFYVFHYMGKDGENKQLVLWGTSGDSLKVMKMRKELLSHRPPQSYEI